MDSLIFNLARNSTTSFPGTLVLCGRSYFTVLQPKFPEARTCDPIWFSTHKENTPYYHYYHKIFSTSLLLCTMHNLSAVSLTDLPALHYLKTKQHQPGNAYLHKLFFAQSLLSHASLRTLFFRGMLHPVNIFEYLWLPDLFRIFSGLLLPVIQLFRGHL